MYSETTVFSEKSYCCFERIQYIKVEHLWQEVLTLFFTNHSSLLFAVFHITPVRAERSVERGTMPKTERAVTL